ncbi:DUF3775 domain-containing protein [Paenibacillus sp. FSL H3-0333]|uniref:DUF3775 domain-containing protein n=1 Tax=Paenibacillus sp. FSL H3-0333 TaxID=2921373 RepID=UPI0030F9E60A
MIIVKVKAILPKIQEAIKLSNIHDNIRNQLDSEAEGQHWLDRVKKKQEDTNFTTTGQNLKEYLIGLTTEEVALIQSVMYIGRESKYDSSVEEEPESALRSLYDRARQQDKDEMVFQITGKKHISRFLWDGLKILGL